MKLIKNLHWIIYSLFIVSCARQTSPTGGPQDTIPPTLEHSNPRNGEVNFKGRTIDLTMSEDVILNDVKQQLIITPNLSNDVHSKTKKNQVILTLDEDLKDNTTYLINFREAVQDITEKNPAQRLKLAFSTGTYIDSLAIEGTIYDPLKNKESKDATVCLYESDTFNIFKHRPTYFTKSDDKGRFKLENLKPGTYFIYTIEDKNKNLVADSKTESYGFLKDSIVLIRNIKNIKLPLIRLDSRPLKLTSARPYGTYYNIKTTKSLTSYKLVTSEDETIISSFGEDFSNIRVYNTFQHRDSLSVRLTATDSINSSLDTTLYVKFQKREVKPDKYDLKTEGFEIIAAKGIIRGKISFTKPVLDINFDSVFYSVDSVQRITFSQENLKWDSLRNTVSLERSFDKNLFPTDDESQNNQTPLSTRTSQPPNQSKKPTIQNQLYFGNAAFISIELDSSNQLSERIPPAKLEDTGIIFIEIQTKAQHFLVQLLTKDFKIIATKRNTRKMSFEDLKPGDYQVRLVIDDNNDGQWSPGNYYKRKEPEHIIYYLNEKNNPTISLKANWELGPLLIKQ